MKGLNQYYSQPNKARSPFSPGKPVPRELFVGRKTEIDQILRAASQVAMGKQENIFLTGEYGMGKSSLGAFIRFAAEEEYKLAGFHVYLGGATTIEKMMEQVISNIIHQTHSNKNFDKVKSILEKYVQEVTLFGVKLNLGTIKKDAPALAHGFLPFLRQIYDSLKDEYQGLTLILDDLNGITRTPEFAALLKSMVDEIATSGLPLPLLLILTGVPERREEILQHQRSVERIFNIAEIKPLSALEVDSFFNDAFASVNIRIEESALKILNKYSGGLPTLMHELGEATFWCDKDDLIDDDDSFDGAFDAADAVGKKYFQPIQRALRSSDYHSILKKLGTLGLELSFSKTEVEKKLTVTEKKKFSNFLQRMKKLQALKSGDQKGEWVFPNRLIRLYLMMESRRK